MLYNYMNSLTSAIQCRKIIILTVLWGYNIWGKLGTKIQNMLSRFHHFVARKTRIPQRARKPPCASPCWDIYHWYSKKKRISFSKDQYHYRKLLLGNFLSFRVQQRQWSGPDNKQIHPRCRNRFKGELLGGLQCANKTWYTLWNVIEEHNKQSHPLKTTICVVQHCYTRWRIYPLSP